MIENSFAFKSNKKVQYLYCTFLIFEELKN